jgi:outer membrane immunogenic protein
VIADVDVLGFTAGRGTGESIDGTTTYPIAGPFGGVNAGYNYQFGPVVLGLNGEINIAGINGGTSWAFYNAGDSVSTALNWFGSIAARAGLAFGQFHAYGLVGWGFGNFTHTLRDEPPCTFVACVVPYEQSVTAVHQGLTFGGGAEFATAGGLVISVEYRRYTFDAQSMGVPGAAVTDWFGDRLDFTPALHTVRVGISKLF